MTAALLLPWVYAILERANFHDFKFDGLHRSRTLWLVPLFYLVAAVGTVLLFPAHLQLFWAFHVLLLAQIAEVLLHQAGYLTGLSLPLIEQFTPLRVGGFVVVLGAQCMQPIDCGVGIRNANSVGSSTTGTTSFRFRASLQRVSA